MKKTLYIIGAAMIVLSSTFAFNIKNADLSSSKEKQTATANKGEGYALQDQDQWK